MLQKALDALPGMTVAVFDQTPSNPPRPPCAPLVAVYQLHRCDGLIAGGGFAIDCAKGMRLLPRTRQQSLP